MPLFEPLRRLISSILGFVAGLWFLTFLLSCGGGSGSSVNNPPPPPAARNPTPAITSISPNSVSAGAPGFTLTITGQNFLSSSVVQWNGSARPTTFTSDVQMQAQISAADVAISGTANISITTPGPGGGNSGDAQFAITSTSNPSPSLGALSPAAVDAGSFSFLLTVTGSHFTPSSVIEWNGGSLPTTYLSTTQLEAQIPASYVVTSGFAAVDVLNPTPGGGVTLPLAFSINYLPTVVGQAATDLVWDKTHQLIYLSVPSLASSNGNTVVALDPTTGSIQSSRFAGSEPDKLAISADNQFLYVALDGSSSIQRFTLPNLLPDINYSLGAVPFFGPTFGWDLQVAPSLPHTTAVSRGVFTTSPYSALAGLAVYDDGTSRPAMASTPGKLYDSLQWASNTTIYANNAEVSTFDFYALTANASGVTLAHDYPNVFSSFYMSIHYDPVTNRIYGDDGSIVDPTTGQLTGTFLASGLMVPDPSTNAAYFLGQTAFQFGTTNATIAAFDLTTLSPLSQIVIPNVQGNPLHLIRWGSTGLAFNDDAGRVYVINDNSFVAASSARPGVARSYTSPVQRTRAFPRVVRSSKAMPNSGISTSAIVHPRLAYSAAPNPPPSITVLSPSAVAAGVNGLTLTVFGSNFLSLSSVLWNGSPLATEFVSSTELQAQVSSSDVIAGGSVAITVKTPSPGGGTSNALPFTILSSTSNHAPLLTSLYPNAIAAGSPGFTLSINGYAYFTPSTIVEWNGSPRPSTLYSPGQLQVQINTSDLTTPGYAQITVINPGPGGGTASAAFQILYQSTIVPQTTNDMVWDPLNQLIYVSVPGSAATHRNQVCSLNPQTAAIITCQNAGTDPDVLAISDDSHFLYVGEDGSAAVQRFILPSLTRDISFSLGSDPFFGAYYALDIQVAPGAPHTTAISRGIPNVIPGAQGGITIFDDGTPRPISTIGCGSPLGGCFDSVQWGPDAGTLYAANTEVSSMDFYTLTVSASGVTLLNDYEGVFWNPGRIHYDRGSGLVYSDDGFHAVDPSTGLPAGIFEVGGGWPMAPDSTLGHVFILGQYIGQAYSNYTLSVFDMQQYVPLARIPFSTAQGGINRLGHFIRWGSNGLAVNDKQGNLYLISAPFVN